MYRDLYARVIDLIQLLLSPVSRLFKIIIIIIVNYDYLDCAYIIISIAPRPNLTGRRAGFVAAGSLLVH